MDENHIVVIPIPSDGMVTYGNEDTEKIPKIYRKDQNSTKNEKMIEKNENNDICLPYLLELWHHIESIELFRNAYYLTYCVSYDVHYLVENILQCRFKVKRVLRSPGRSGQRERRTNRCCQQGEAFERDS